MSPLTQKGKIKMTETNELVMPSSPADIKKLKGMIEEAALCLQKIADQQEHLKDIYSTIKEDLNIAPKYSRKLAKTYYKHNFSEVQAENEEFEKLYTQVVELD